MTEKVVNREYVDKNGSVTGGKVEYWLTNNGLKPANQTTDNLVNKAVKVTQLITMTSGKQYYLATVNGKQIAWIPMDAFKQEETVVNRQYIDKTGTVNNGQPEYWLTDSGIKSANQTTSNLVNKSVKVTQLTTTTTGKQYYLATVNGKQVAWISVVAFK
ncbi:GW dipeptide domain-containing protein [Latilactobacillus curvatus]|uniref:GW dipeptide domain-containing protein n=1 Tax=Latilactobacillus curvatus TaxID=28038 RepID=UPI0039AF4BD4